MNLLDYTPGDSFLHKMNPVIKLLCAFLYGIASIICGNVFIEIGLILIMIGIATMAGLFRRAVMLTRNLFILGLIMFVLQMFFVRGGEPLLTIGSVVLITSYGLESAFLLTFRVIATMQPLMLLFAMTQMNDLCNALVKNCHVPYRYAFVVTTAFRFVPLFSAEYHDIEDAQKTRGVEFDTKDIIKKFKLVIPLCVPLVMSSMKKVDVSAASAQVRGFKLRTVTSGYKEYPIETRDIVAVILMVLLDAGMIVVKRFL